MSLTVDLIMYIRKGVGVVAKVELFHQIILISLVCISVVLVSIVKVLDIILY